MVYDLRQILVGILNRGAYRAENVELHVVEITHAYIIFVLET
jgi:hypothetical protein